MKPENIDDLYRVDFEVIVPYVGSSGTSIDLAKIQAKLNQWITKKELISYNVYVVENKLVFEIFRYKQS